MYQPPHFREEDRERQHALVRSHPLGLLITAGAQGPTANLLPFHLVADAGEMGMLQVHMARANGQWKEIAAGAPVLVVFQGPDAYVTPSWYATKRDNGKVVPTWNYAVVQVRGQATVIEDAAWLRGQIERLTAQHETPRAQPWAVGDAPAPFIASQIKGIVGVEIAITEIAGKWKASQNRTVDDAKGVVDGLSNTADAHSNSDMAELVNDYLSKRGR